MSVWQAVAVTVAGGLLLGGGAVIGGLWSGRRVVRRQERAESARWEAGKRATACGGLIAARPMTEADVREARDRFLAAQQRPHKITVLDPAAFRQVDPALCPHVQWLDVTPFEGAHLEEMCAGCGGQRWRDRVSGDVVRGIGAP